MATWKNSKLKMAALGLAVVMAIGAIGCGGSEKKEQPKKWSKANVGIVQLVEHAALDAANKGFVEGLSRRGYKEGDNITFDRQNAQADQSNLQNIANRFVNNKVDLICAIATPAAQTVANATSTIPIVGTAITDYEAAKLVKSNTKPGGNVTGTTDMNPVAAQLDLLLKIKPGIKTVGTIYTSSEVNSQIQIDILKKAAAEKNVKIVEATVSSVNDIQQAARSLVGKCEGIYVPTDNILASAMPTLTIITDEAKLPVLCGEENMVAAGGTATLGINYYELGLVTGDMAADILQGKAKPAEMAIQSQKKFTPVINMKVAEKLGVKVSDDLLKGATVIRK